MISVEKNRSFNVPAYIFPCLLIVICLISAALGRWMNYASVLAIFGFLFIFLYKQEKNVSLSIAELCLVLFFAIYAILSNILFNGSEVETYLLLNYIVVISYFVFVRQDINSIKAIIMLINLFCICEAIFIILQEYAYGIWVKFAYNIVGYANNRISGFMSDYSLSGYVVAIGVILSFYTIKNKYLKVLSVIINFFALLVTTKRSHLLILLVVIVLLYIINAKNKKKAIFSSFALAAVIAIVCYLFYVFSDSNNAIVRLVDTFIGYFNGEDIDELSSNRSIIYEYAIDYWLSSTKTIWFGNGWGYFEKTFDYYSSIATAHNVYLQLLCETGLVGLLAFAFCALYALYHSIMNLVYIKDKSIRKYAIVSFYIQIHFLAYCFLGSPLYDTVCLFYYIIAISFSEYLWFAYVKTTRKHKIKFKF